MRIRVKEPFRTYFNYQVHRLAAGDVVKGSLAEHVAGDPRVEVIDAPAPAPKPDGLDIDGTAAEVLAWVGDDDERALEAFEAESAKGKPRSTLLAQLEKLIGD
jgi:hypothetical protein